MKVPMEIGVWDEHHELLPAGKQPQTPQTVCTHITKFLQHDPIKQTAFLKFSRCQLEYVWPFYESTPSTRPTKSFPAAQTTLRQRRRIPCGGGAEYLAAVRRIPCGAGAKCRRRIPCGGGAEDLAAVAQNTLRRWRRIPCDSGAEYLAAAA